MPEVCGAQLLRRQDEHKFTNLCRTRKFVAKKKQESACGASRNGKMARATVRRSSCSRSHASRHTGHTSAFAALAAPGAPEAVTAAASGAAGAFVFL